MNANQAAKFAVLESDAMALGHEVRERPAMAAMVSVICSCGWTAAESRRQNALARNARLTAKIRAHYQQAVKGAQS
jgi:hypothetical protein